MITTIKLDSEVQEQLKLKSDETGKSQLELANKYILEGLKYDKTPKKDTMDVEDIEKLLKHDKINKNNANVFNHEYKIPDMLKLKENGELNKPVSDLKEIKKLLKHDSIGGNNLEDIVGIVKADKPTNAVTLKKENHIRS